MPSPTITIASSLLLAASALSVALSVDLKRFLAGMPVLTSISGVIAFRKAVARQMYGAFVVLILVGAAATVVTLGLVLRAAEWGDLPPVLFALALFAASALWCRMVERRARRIPVVDAEIGQRRDEVVRVWRSKPLPVWGDSLFA